MYLFLKMFFAFSGVLIFASLLYANPVAITFDESDLSSLHSIKGFEFSAWVPDYNNGPFAPDIRTSFGGLDGGLWVNSDDNAYISVAFMNGAFSALSIDARSPGAVLPGYYGLSIGLVGFDETGNIVAQMGAFLDGPAAFDWMSINLAENGFLNIYELRIYQGQGVYCNYFDNLVLSPVPEPTSIFLFGVGIAGLAGAARKKRK